MGAARHVSSGAHLPKLWANWGLVVIQESKNLSPYWTAEFTQPATWSPGSRWATPALLSTIPQQPPHAAASGPNENILFSKGYGEHTAPSTVHRRGREGRGTA